MSIDLTQMSAVECYKAFIEAKQIISSQTVIRKMIKQHYETPTKAAGRLVLFVDAAGIAHGFTFENGSATINVKNLEAALTKRGVAAEDIAAIKKEAKGEPSQTFTEF